MESGLGGLAERVLSLEGEGWGYNRLYRQLRGNGSCYKRFQSGWG